MSNFQSHDKIEGEAVLVKLKITKPRNPVLDPAPWISTSMLCGVKKDGRVTGYAKGSAHKGTFYAECEGVQQYPDEDFLRVVMYGDEFHDKETRIPLAMLRAVGFIVPGDKQ